MSEQKAGLSSLQGLSETNLVEIAREFGPSVLDFLKDVMRGNHNELHLDKPIPIKDRLVAADLLRKFASLPTNVQLDLGIREKLVYIGDMDVTPAISGSSAPVLREGVETKSRPVGGPPRSSERDDVRGDSGWESVREERLAD